MPLLWIEYNGVKEEVRYSDAGICDLRFLSCEPHSLRLNGLAGYVDIVTSSFNVSDLRADTTALRGSNEANPIVVTGRPGMSHCITMLEGNASHTDRILPTALYLVPFGPSVGTCGGGGGGSGGDSGGDHIFILPVDSRNKTYFCCPISCPDHAHAPHGPHATL